MGDTVYECHVRKHLLEDGAVNPHRLHQTATSFVSAKAQCAAIHYLLDQDLLCAHEIAIVRRGRNAKSATVPKNTDITTYRYATGLEALIGYLYLNADHERVDQIMNWVISFCEERKG